MSATLGTFNNGSSSIVAGTASTTPLTINSQAGIQFCNNSGVQLGSICNISSGGVLNCSGLTISGPLTCSSLIIPNNGTITCLGSLACSGAITGVTSLDCNSINSIKVNNRPFAMFITGSNSNGTTLQNGRIGAVPTQTTGFSVVTTFGGALSSHWNVASAEFTAPTAGLYSIQLNVFNNVSNTIGRTMKIISPAFLEGFQYCVFNGQSTSGESAFQWTQTLWLNSGETFYFQNESTANLTLYYANGHTTLSIIRIY